MNDSVYSMTGYAVVKDYLGFAIEIRCVNSRFLDVTFKIPDAHRHLESKFKDRLISKIRRGKCELKLSFVQDHSAKFSNSNSLASAGSGANSSDGFVDLVNVQAWLNHQAKIQTIAPQATPLSVAEIIQFCLSAQKHSNPVETPQVSDEQLLSLCDLALSELNTARALEGAKLTQAMLGGVQRLNVLLAELMPLVPALVEQQKARFMQKFQEALSDNGNPISASAAQDRALAEVTAFAIRIDTTEEVDRLSSHLAEIENLLKNGGSKRGQDIGKRLEFFIQELHREVNTVDSKSASLATTQIAVEMKVVIEQLREQVQNIE
jgi:uncharacterized protein (TIGR00255 family)